MLAVDDYWQLRKGDIKEIANVKFVDYFSDNRELFVYDASRISQFYGVHVNLQSIRISLVFRVPVLRAV